MYMILRSLEAYLLRRHLGRNTEAPIGFDPEGNIPYKSKGRQALLRPRFWGPLDSMYLAHVYADMLTQGYLVLPMEGGWIVQGGEEPYYLTEKADGCTCKDHTYRGSHCQHILMVEAHLDIRRRQVEAKRLYSR
jgi:hypothetical protein